jgi:hypothetical protein
VMWRGSGGGEGGGDMHDSGGKCIKHFDGEKFSKETTWKTVV